MTRFYQDDFETVKWLQNMPADGYIANIRDVVIYDNNNNNGKSITFLIDIAEGKYQGYFDYMYLFDSEMKFDCGYVIHLPSEQDKLNSFIHILQQSNPNFQFHGDLSQLMGMEFGMVLQEQKCIEPDGTSSVQLKIFEVTTVESIRNGNYIFPEKSALPLQQFDAVR